ncbi:MAG: HU family DNA-binding protein [Prolixibacteraceae bacterium]|jgi:predicted histone-like DNA-binding protein
MPINYKVVKRAQAGVKGGGLLKYHAVATGRKVVNTRELARMISDRCTARPGDVKIVLAELAELIPELLRSGVSVQLEEIGIFSATLVAQLKDTPEEVNESSIKGLRVQFRADNYLKAQIGVSKFKRVKAKLNPPPQS